MVAFSDFYHHDCFFRKVFQAKKANAPAVMRTGDAGTCGATHLQVSGGRKAAATAVGGDRRAWG